MLFFGISKNQSDRDKIINHLNKHGVDARKTWTPIHMQPCNSELSKNRCKNAEEIFDKALTLPIYNNMKIEDANTIIKLLD